MYKLIESKKYRKRVIKFLKKHPEIFPKYEKTIFLLTSNPFHPSLRLHKLKGELSEYYSVSIDMDYRIILDFIIVEKEIILIDIGSHDEVY